MVGAILLWAMGVYLLGVIALGLWAYVTEGDLPDWRRDSWVGYLALGLLWPLIALWIAAQWFEALGAKLKGSR